MTTTLAVDRYIADAPAPMQPALTEMRTLIHEHLPGLTELVCSNGFAVYTNSANEWIAGFAWRKKGPMLYIMAKGVLDRYDDQLGSLRSGRSCVEWKASSTMTMDDLRKLAADMLHDAASVADVNPG